MVFDGAVVSAVATELADFCILIVLFLNNFQHFRPVGGRDKFAVCVEQLQGIPLHRVVRSSEDDAAVGFVLDDGHLNGGGGRKTKVNHIHSKRLQRTASQFIDNFTRNTGIAPNDNGERFFFAVFQQSDEGGNKLHHIERGEVVACFPADGSANAGDRFD